MDFAAFQVAQYDYTRFMSDFASLLLLLSCAAHVQTHPHPIHQRSPNLRTPEHDPHSQQSQHQSERIPTHLAAARTTQRPLPHPTHAPLPPPLRREQRHRDVLPRRMHQCRADLRTHFLLAVLRLVDPASLDHEN